jgi:hypothetical protein
MPSRSFGSRTLLLLLWMAAFAIIPVYIHFDHVGWDLGVYARAAHELQAGHDPYADGIEAENDLFGHRTLLNQDRTMLPYLYPPVTLPVLRAIGGLSIRRRFWTGLYWLLYVAGVLTQVYVGVQFSELRERRVLVLVAPAIMFFPGLLRHDDIFGGNISFIVYGTVLAAALAGWRRGRWLWFYLAVLAASCCKAPWLTLLAIPVLSARRQWLPACCVAMAGAVMCAVQLLLWPTLFHEWVQGIGLEFRLVGFGLSPAGLLARTLFEHGIAYSFASVAFYLIYASMIFGLLLYLSRLYLKGRFSFERWVPVMLLGVMLLNPRIKDYDVAPLTIAMALIGVRLFGSVISFAWAVAGCASVMLAANLTNIFAGAGVNSWNSTECVLLVGLFAGGCWSLLRMSGAYRVAREERVLVASRS